MTIIRIEELNTKNDELSYLSDLSDSETELTRGGLLPFIAAAWLGYSIAKEAKLKYNEYKNS